jgi:hypothetical protein
MKTKVFKGQLKFNSPINIERSLTPVLENISVNTESIIDVSINEDGKGFFEWSIEELDEYETGGLWFEGNELIDFDGVFELPSQLIEFLEEKKYNMDWAK